MTLAPGTRFGPYEVVAPLGAGGMGEVYRAKDTRLGREVAIKVLPAEVASDPERLRRFTQEAKAASALNHPNILTVHDFGREGDTVYLVTELLEGESLRGLLQRGAVDERQAIEIVSSVARGLAAAHERGIVHRDLKPENLFVTRRGGVKILDFGLARIERAQAPPGMSLADVTTFLETQAGSVLGTPGYMAPEQVRGEKADARSDLFALGVVLYELLAGVNPFRRATVVESLHAILHDAAPELRERARASPQVARIVRHLLEKDADRRFRSAHDLAFALEGAEAPSQEALAAGPATVPARRLPSGPAIVGLALLVAAAGTAYWLGRRQAASTPAPAIRFEMAPPETANFAADTVEDAPLAVSPDGRTIAFVGWEGGSRFMTEAATRSRIWLRRLDEPEARPLEGTDGARSLTWSPDGRAIAYFSGARLLRIGLDGSAPVPICDVPAGMGYAASWSSTGQVLFASIQGDTIWRVPASGGTAERALTSPSPKNASRIGWPTWLPDGRGFLYYERTSGGKEALMLADGDRAPRDVAPIGSRVELVAPSWLLFARDGALYAQRFDRAAARLVGAAVAVAPHVRSFYSNGWAGFAASPTGTIVHFAGQNSSRLLWYRSRWRRGGERRIAGRLSEPLHLAGRRQRPGRPHPARARDLRSLGGFDLERGTESRLTTSPNADFDGVWFPDGRSFVYSTVLGRAPNLFRRDLVTGQDEPLLPSDDFQNATDISRDGRLLAYLDRGPSGKFHARLLPLVGDRTPVDLLPEDAGESSVRFSPDGRDVAYVSDLSGQDEAYVAPLSAPNASTRISLAGASIVRWSRDGREIFVLSAHGELASYPVRTAPTLEIGAPKTLFRVPGGSGWSAFDVAPDGKRFLAVVRERSANEYPASVVVGWRPPPAK